MPCITSDDEYWASRTSGPRRPAGFDDTPAYEDLPLEPNQSRLLIKRLNLVTAALLRAYEHHPLLFDQEKDPGLRRFVLEAKHRKDKAEAAELLKQQKQKERADALTKLHAALTPDELALLGITEIKE